MKPPKMALSPLVGLLQRLQIVMAVSAAHPLKNEWTIFDEQVKVRRLQRRNRQKLRRLFLICRRRGRLKAAHNLPILLPRLRYLLTIVKQAKMLCNDMQRIGGGRR